MSDIITLITTNGIGVFLVGYIVYIQERTLKALVKSQSKTNNYLKKIVKKFIGEEVEDEDEDE